MAVPQRTEYSNGESDIDVNEFTSIIENEEGGSQASFDLSDVLHKRRGGLGWNVENNWVPRLFTLYGPIFCYYETTDIKYADPSRPRNRIDLSKEETIAEMLIKHKQGAPSDYLVFLNLYIPLGGKRKWELCCNSKEQQHRWYEALRRFDGKPKSRSYNVCDSKLDRKSAKQCSVSRHPILDDETGNFYVPLATFTNPEERNIHVLISFGLINASAVMIKFGSDGASWISVIILNLTISYLCAHVTTLSLQRRESSYRKSGKLLLSNKSNNNGFSTFFESTISRASPKSSELNELIQKYGMKSSTVIQACAATTTDYNEEPHSYWNVESSRFHLRVGPNYKKNKTKKPSGKALYDLYALELVNSQSNLSSVEKGFKIPHISGLTDVPTGHPYVPPMITLLINMPSGETSMFQNPTSGPSYVAVLFLVITENTRKALQDLENASPAVKLLAEWCEHAETNETCKGRFKFMAMVDNIESVGLPSFITGFNGKPILINKSGKFTRHENYIEMSINVHTWSYVARKGLYTLLPRFQDIIVNIGATIEGRNDDEQPECLLGGVRAIHLNLDKIVIDGKQ